MLAILPRLKTTSPHQISSYLTLTTKRISNVFAKGIFGYLLRAPLKVETYNYVSRSITGSFSFIGSLVTSKSSCALTKGLNQKKKISSCSIITLNSLVSDFLTHPIYLSSFWKYEKVEMKQKWLKIKKGWEFREASWLDRVRQSS
jgi:hypothetical protein